MSSGCLHCYAERQAARNLPGLKSPATGEQFAIITPSGPRWTGKVELIPHMLDLPLLRRTPTTYFVNSMSDLFHESLPDADIDQVFAVMAHSWSRAHTFQVLTKRTERMRQYFADPDLYERWLVAVNVVRNRWSGLPIGGLSDPVNFPLQRVWLGVSVEDRANLKRIDDLRQTPAAVRFLSLEPLLEDLGLLDLTGIDWAIVGGESGPGARKCELAWIHSIVEQCEAAGVPCFVKQLGAMPVSSQCGLIADVHFPGNPSLVPHSIGAGGEQLYYAELKDHKGGDMAEWPSSLRVREMPNSTKPEKEGERSAVHQAARATVAGQTVAGKSGPRYPAPGGAR